MDKLPPSRTAFTMIELLLVVAIIAILAGIAIGVTKVARQQAAEAKTESFIQELQVALEMFKQDHGYFPPTGGEYTGINSTFIGSLRDNDSGRFFLTVDTLTYNETGVLDGFGQHFQYACPGQVNTELYDIRSSGNDAKFDTGDDLNNFSRR